MASPTIHPLSCWIPRPHYRFLLSLRSISRFYRFHLWKKIPRSFHFQSSLLLLTPLPGVIISHGFLQEAHKITWPIAPATPTLPLASAEVKFLNCRSACHTPLLTIFLLSIPQILRACSSPRVVFSPHPPPRMLIFQLLAWMAHYWVSASNITRLKQQHPIQLGPSRVPLLLFHVPSAWHGSHGRMPLEYIPHQVTRFWKMLIMRNLEQPNVGIGHLVKKSWRHPEKSSFAMLWFIS